MTSNSFLSILMVLILAAVWMLGLALLQKKLALHPEGWRKLLHMGSGLLALGLPGWFQSAVSVMALSAASLLGLLALKRIPALRHGPGRVIDGVERDSHGDLYFVGATGLLFLFSGGDRLLFSVPMAILTFADSAAALVGQRYGRHRFQSAGGTKSLEGSAAFFLTAVVGAYVGLQILGDTGAAATLLLALLLALHLTLVEASAGRGLDNLLIPLTGCLLLRVFLGSPASLLMLHLLAAVSAGVLAVLMSRHFLGYRLNSLGGA
jgi:phytol kinase